MLLHPLTFLQTSIPHESSALPKPDRPQSSLFPHPPNERPFHDYTTTIIIAAMREEDRSLAGKTDPVASTLTSRW